MSQTKTQIVQELPKEEYNREWPGEKNYKFMKKVNDPRFGDVTIEKNHQTGDVLFVKEHLASSKKEADQDILNLKSRMRLNDPRMLQMVDYSTKEQKQLCSTNYLSRAFYRYPQSDMQRELLDHKKNLTEFSSAELSKCKEDMLGAVQTLHSKDLTHGDIRPMLIGHDKNTNTFQLLDRFKDPSPLEKAQINNLIAKKDLYLSPNLYKKLQGKAKDVNYDPKKNDLHALGMTLLNLGTQDSVQDCYNPDGTMNNTKLQQHLNDFGQKYAHDPSLVNSVNNLVSPDDNARNGNLSGGFAQAKQTKVQSTPPQDNYVFTPNTQTNVHSDYFAHNDHDEINPYMVKTQNTYNVKSTPENVVSTYPQTEMPKSTFVKSYQDPTYSTTNDSTYQNTTYSTYTEPTSYNFNQPTTTYVQSTPTSTYVQNTPTTTYVQNTPSTTYVQNTPQTTYVQNTPQTTYVQNTPQTTYVQNTPQTTTYVSSTPTTTYQTNTPTTTYVQNTPQTTSYVSTTPTTNTYISNTPTTTYVQGQPTTNLVSNYPTEYKSSYNTETTYTNTDNLPYYTTYETDSQGRKVEVRKYKEGYVPPEEPQILTTKGTETYLQNQPYTFTTTDNVVKTTPYSYTTTDNIAKTTPYSYTTTDNVVKTTPYSYTSTENVVKTTPYSYTTTDNVVKTTPYSYTTTDNIAKTTPYSYTTTDNIVKTTPYSYTTTENVVQNQPYTFTTTENVVKSQPYSYTTTENVVKTTPYSYTTTENVVKTTPYSYTTTENVTYDGQNQYKGTTNYTTETNTYVTGDVRRSHGNVEVRRGSHIPPEQQQQVNVTEVKKRYVMKEDGTVVEVDAENNINSQQIQITQYN